ncbi:hypothetical protein HJC99_03120 [Candidatus Saccharibacteria bacterium]|nr:hypothetical protein [Candidatus Saccharibacteria bacterium]
MTEATIKQQRRRLAIRACIPTQQREVTCIIDVLAGVGEARPFDPDDLSHWLAVDIEVDGEKITGLLSAPYRLAADSQIVLASLTIATGELEIDDDAELIERLRTCHNIFGWNRLFGDCDRIEVGHDPDKLELQTFVLFPPLADDPSTGLNAPTSLEGSK